MQSITIDILNSKALVLLKDLEALHLIKLRTEPADIAPVDWVAKYKGAMSKQPLSDIDAQLNQLRDEWE